ncbi:hypothetical protein D917_05815 [Trichinella nativa]|uniref:Uncharacterized protein n=1 Tax=Trichinella nativa TaxID=6335 RepID=A0A1Y3EVK2_9BILA|nr:hypothetical protein D917_05815 [Trichinella nativa]
MSEPGFKSFHSWVYRWDSSATIWFIMVEEDGFPFLQLRAGKNGACESNFHSMTAVGRKSLEMGGLAREAGFNISDIICAPSVKCIVAAGSFIYAFQCEKKDEIKGLNIKIDGAFSSTTEGYYLHKQFRSLAAERGYNVDETYKHGTECGRCLCGQIFEERADRCYWSVRGTVPTTYSPCTRFPVASGEKR